MAKNSAVRIEDVPVTGERAPALRVMNPATPMARMLRDGLDRNPASDVVSSRDCRCGLPSGAQRAEA